MQARLIDELPVAVFPVLLGQGSALFEGSHLPALGYRVTLTTPNEFVTHVVIGR